MASEHVSTVADSTTLDERSRNILDFENEWSQRSGAKEEAIRDRFGLSAARYYQLLGVLIDSPDAMRYDPMLVKRLIRMRDARSQARRKRSLHFDE